MGIGCPFRGSPAGYADGSWPLKYKEHAQRRYASTYGRFILD